MVLDPVLVICTSAVKPLFHELAVYFTAQAPEPDGGGVVVGGGLLPPPLTAAEKLVTARPAPPCHGSKPAWMLVRYHELVIAPRLRVSLMKASRLRFALLIADGAT